MTSGRVLFVSGDATGSAASRLQTFATRLQENGWKVTIAAPQAAVLAELTVNTAVAMVVVPGLLDVSAPPQLRELIGDHDVIVANTIESWPVIRAANNAGKPIAWCLGESEITPPASALLLEIRTALELAWTLVVPSSLASFALPALTRTPVAVVETGVDFAALLQRLLRQTHREIEVRDYGMWSALYSDLKEPSRLALRREIRQLRHPPLISVVMPVFNPDLRFLREAIESVKRQVYERWELCIADDCSTDPGVRRVLEEAASVEPRLRVNFREQNGHISAASNSALALATGDWCALLDHDDALAEGALAFVAQELAAHPCAGLIYSDEDKIDEAGVRSNPFFKTDWNPELFLAQNYINHLGVYRTELLREMGGFRMGFEGSQDYDLALRCIERLEPSQIRHIPRVLYHWRSAAGSVAGAVVAKPYAREAARRAIADHLQRSLVDAQVEPCPENPEFHRVVYAMPADPPLVSVIILTRDRAALLERCVRSIRDGTDYTNVEIIIVDNGSREQETRELFERLTNEPDTCVLRDEGEFNFSRLNNHAVRHARGELLLFLNNDIEAGNPGWLREMVSHAVRRGIGAVGARLWYPDDTMQHGGVVLGLGGAAGHAHVRLAHGHPGYSSRALLQGNYSAVTAACMLMPRAAFEAVKGFDEHDLAVNFNDVDLCLRLRARGLQVVWTPYANLLHHESASRGHNRSETEKAQFAREVTYMQLNWGAELMNDPLYSPNLSLNLPGFELAFPPRVHPSSRCVATFSRAAIAGATAAA